MKRTLKKIYAIIWYLFLFIFLVWLLGGFFYNTFYKDKIQSECIRLTRVLTAEFPSSIYLLSGPPYETNRRNLISKAISLDIKKNNDISTIAEVRPIHDGWILVRSNFNYYIYENESYIIYIVFNEQMDIFQVTIAENNWLENFNL